MQPKLSCDTIFLMALCIHNRKGLFVSSNKEGHGRFDAIIRSDKQLILFGLGRVYKRDLNHDDDRGADNIPSD